MSAFANIAKIPELRRRILFTLGMLSVYRIGIFVTTPGVNRKAMQEVVQSQGGLLGMFNLFSGGALEQLSIFALNIMPYVTASIILSLLTVVVKPLEELRKEGEAGQRKINQYTRYGTVVLSLAQSIGISFWLMSLTSESGKVVREDSTWFFVMMTCIALTTGTSFLMWLGEQITERGIGNGISLIIFAGIVANLPDALVQTGSMVTIGQIQPITVLFIVVIAVGIISVITFFERAQRRLPIQYGKRIVGRKRYGGQVSHLPLKVNMSGVIPPIFASSLMLFPITLSGWNVPYMDEIQRVLAPGEWIYTVLFAVMVIFFCYFYTSITFQPVDVAENLKKQNANIPGVRPGKQTADYIERVVTRITFGGAMYVAVVCTVPDLMRASWHVPFYLGGTSLMIVVGVALDTVQQIESHLITRHYEGLTGPKGPRIRRRRA
jgi:preprotein translocase subunit SecY